MTKQHPKRQKQAQNTAQPRTTHARTARADASRSRATRQAQEARARRTRIVWWSIGGAAALAIVMILAGLPQGDASRTPGDAIGNPDPATGQQDAGSPSFNLERRDPDDVTAIGRVDAPVVMVEYADYRCPFCGVFDRDTKPALVREYVDAGKLRIEWRDLPVFGEQSIAAAVAARAAGRQGMFWEYHTAMFAAAPERGHPELPRERLLEFAREIGVPDIARFTADLDDPALASAVQTDYTEGTRIGIASTPIFIINDTPVAGAQPIDVFRQTIDAAIAVAEASDASTRPTTPASQKAE